MKMQLGGADPTQEPLPPLRQDLELSHTGHTGGGAPVYTIHDALAGRYYRIGWLQFEILTHWQAGKPAEVVVQALRARPFLQVDEEDVKAMLGFIKRHHLNVAHDAEQTAQIATEARAAKTGWAKFALKNYLYLKVPLVRPDRFLTNVEGRLRFLFTRGFLLTVMVLAAIGALLIAQDWVRWFADFAIIKTPEGIMLTAIVLLFSKVVHEFGHGLAAKYYGCRVPRMGVALILLWPVLWTDTTDAWRIADHRKRLVIDGAGVIAELSLAAVATILWSVCPDGMLKTALHLLSGIAWIMTLAVNANPFMRFDGYYLTADGVNIPNLQERSFAYTRWWLRRHILWSDDAPPESWPPKTALFLLGYAMCCWLYRLVLFTGIALMVYAYFFKAAGIFLFIIEIWWFIGRPVMGEVANWKRQLATKRAPPVFIGIVLFMLVSLFVAALPVHQTLSLTGYARAANEYLLEAPAPAALLEFKLTNGQKVKAGTQLAVLDAPELTYRMDMSSAQAGALQRQYEQNVLSGETYRRAERYGGEATVRRAEVAGYRASRDNLTLIAQTDGVIRDVPAGLREGDWVERRDRLGILVGSGVIIHVFVNEAQLVRLEKGQHASVISAADPQIKDIDFIVDTVSTSPVDLLPYPELSAENGGPVSMRPSRKGQGPVPSEQLFRVTLKPADPAQASTILRQSGPVDLHIEATPHSPLMAFLRKAMSVLIRETGF